MITTIHDCRGSCLSMVSLPSTLCLWSSERAYDARMDGSYIGLNKKQPNELPTPSAVAVCTGFPCPLSPGTVTHTQLNGCGLDGQCSCRGVSLRPHAFFASPGLLQALVLHTARPADGAVLLVTIDHVTGDAASCELLMQAWSASYKAHSGAAHYVLPEAPLKANLVHRCAQPAHVLRRFYFRAPDFAPLKAYIADGASGFTTNDVLMAVCLCALAPFRARDTASARLSLMANARGRGLPVDFMGNGAVPMDVYVPWDLLLSFDLASVVRAVRAGMTEALKALPALCAAPPQDPPPQEPILVWNSWARVRGLVEADFGLGLRQWEWMNSFQLEDPACFLVVPEIAPGGLCLHASLPVHEMAYLVTVWDSMLNFQVPSGPA